AQRADVRTGGRINTVATGNLSHGALLLDQGSLLDLGANLVLSEDLDIRGTAANVATVDANGHDITARDIFIGRFAAAGEILNRGTITATSDLGVSNSTFALGANDSVADTVGAGDGGELTLHANTAAQRA